jgi:Protein of unknown function (DUF4012)
MQEQTQLNDAPSTKRGMATTSNTRELRVKGKKRKAKRFYFFLIALALLGMIGTALADIGYHTYSATYQKDLSLAQAGVQHLRTAETLLKALPENPFNSQSVSQARGEFADAFAAFSQINNDLKSLPGISTSLPVYGSRLDAALHLLPVAIELSQVGVIGCASLNLLISRLHDPLSTGTQGIAVADFSVIEGNFHRIEAALTTAFGQINRLTPEDLQVDPRLGKAFATFRTDIPQLQTWLQTIDNLLPIVPTLLGIGTPANYLIEVLDSTELRPGGGFIGNYGLATFSGGRLTAAHITDTYLLDDAYAAAGHTIPYPPAYSWFDLAQGSWSFRDSNLDADFPTVARYAELNYAREGGNAPVQGVIAITPSFIEQALEITGPIEVPEYHETVTAQNLVDLIHYYQLSQESEGGDIPSPDGHSSLRKHFTELLAEHFLARVRQVSSSALPKFAQLIISSLRSKDVQIYLNPASAEDVLQTYRLNSAIQAPSGDSLFVVDANISPNKANRLITNTLSDQVTIDARGNAIHRTTISYAWVGQGQSYGSNVYRDYVRVYAPRDSALQEQDGWQPRGTSQAFGREVWAGFVTLSYSQVATITIVWRVPDAALKGAKGWHYQYLIQRQAGAQWTLHLQITLPPCGVMKQKWGGLISSDKQEASLSQPLTEDVSVGIDYIC